jgi:hypothetical protein
LPAAGAAAAPEALMAADVLVLCVQVGVRIRIKDSDMQMD